jgi:glycosyltransferase involved in cell wall biosynthesis
MSGVPWGGSEELWSQAAVRLAQDDHEVSASVVWWPQLSRNVEEIEKQGVKLFTRRPPQPKLPARLFRKVKRLILLEEEEEFQWLRQQKPDLVVVSQGGNIDGVNWMNFCDSAGLPVASIVQCNVDGWYPDDAFSVEMAQAYRIAKRVFFVSNHNLQLLQHQIGETLANASVVWNPYNIANDHVPPWPKDDGVWRLACVARLDPWYKGQDVLFQVLAQPQWRDRAVEVNLYGSGTCQRILQLLADRLQLKTVRFCGHVSNVNTIWRENHLLVLPSRCEGLPLALVEAMWCARAAIVTDVGGNAELCLDEETGFVAGAPVPVVFAQALERAWNRRQDWKQMGILARRRAEQLIPRDPVGDFCAQLTACVERDEEKAIGNGQGIRP